MNNGYYVSEPIHWVDWHAGVKLEGDNYYVIKFDAMKCYFDSVSDVNSISLDNLSKKENFGLYEVMESSVEIRYNPNTEFEVKRHFTILSPDILLDEERREYRFVEFSLETSK